jgi:cytochrome c-type biogenesis protein CcmH
MTVCISMGKSFLKWPIGRFLLALWLVCSPAFAGEAVPAAEDPQLEARVRALSEELRCLVCQNQTLADSNAPLAEDLRREVREKMRAGMSNQAIIEFLVSRYGDFVLYRPPFKATTALLWAGPFLLLAAGGAVLYLNLARRRRRISDHPLQPEEHRQAMHLLGEDR